MTKIEAVVVRDRVETVMDAVEELTGHVGVTVIEAVGHGRQRGITHEYRGRVFESRFLPKALLIFLVEDEKVDAVVDAIVDAARTGHVSGDGIWTLQAGIFPENRASLALHHACGFRTVGFRERIGRLDGAWRDVVLLERRSKEIA